MYVYYILSVKYKLDQWNSINSAYYIGNFFQEMLADIIGKKKTLQFLDSF